MSSQLIIERSEAKKFGLLRYFTGKPCGNGHVAERLVSTKGCLDCHNLRSGRINKERYRRAKASGICDRCGAAADPGRTKCSNCRASMKTDAADRRNKRRQDGLCIVCGFVAPIVGADYCEGCKIKNAAAHNTLRAARFASDPGLCRTCAIRPAIKGRSYCAQCNDKNLEHRRQFRLEVLAVYGGKCQCCGEKEPDFLTIDHVNGRVDVGGNRDIRTGYGLYLWIKRQGYPADYQVLCWNCNCAKGKYGSCPHARKLGQPSGYVAGPPKKGLAQ